MNESTLAQLLSLLGIARRAGRIAAGFDAATGALIGRKAHAVFLTTDCAPRTDRNVRRIAEESGADVLLLPRRHSWATQSAARRPACWR